MPRVHLCYVCQCEAEHQPSSLGLCLLHSGSPGWMQSCQVCSDCGSHTDDGNKTPAGKTDNAFTSNGKIEIVSMARRVEVLQTFINMSCRYQPWDDLLL